MKPSTVKLLFKFFVIVFHVVEKLQSQLLHVSGGCRDAPLRFLPNCGLVYGDNLQKGRRQKRETKRPC